MRQISEILAEDQQQSQQRILCLLILATSVPVVAGGNFHRFLWKQKRKILLWKCAVSIRMYGISCQNHKAHEYLRRCLLQWQSSAFSMLTGLICSSRDTKMTGGSCRYVQHRYIRMTLFSKFIGSILNHKTFYFTNAQIQMGKRLLHLEGYLLFCVMTVLSPEQEQGKLHILCIREALLLFRSVYKYSLQSFHLWLWTHQYQQSKAQTLSLLR